jgi:RHS repeat-associated protein
MGAELTFNMPSELPDNKYLYNGKELQSDFELGWYDYGARFYDPQIGRYHTIDPHGENYYDWTSFNYVANNPMNLVDPDGRDWYQDKSGNTMWQKGSAEVEGYKNIGATHTQDFGNGVSVTFDQNQASEFTETVLNTDDWETQRAASGEASDKKGNKVGEEGNCFVKSGDIVEKSGTKSLDGADNNTASNEKLSYLDSQVDQEKSARVQVDYNGDNSGDHWVAISSRTTDVKTQTTKSFGFYDPGTIRPDAGTHSSNKLKVNSNGSMSGTTNYNGKKYVVVNVRKNN